MHDFCFCSYMPSLNNEEHSESFDGYGTKNSISKPVDLRNLSRKRWLDVKVLA